MSLNRFFVGMGGFVVAICTGHGSFAADNSKTPIYFAVKSTNVGACDQEKAQAISNCKKWASGNKCFYRHFLGQSEKSSLAGLCAESKRLDPDFELSRDETKCGKWEEGVDCDEYSARCLCSDHKPSTGLFNDKLVPLEVPLGMFPFQVIKQFENPSPANTVN